MIDWLIPDWAIRITSATPIDEARRERDRLLGGAVVFEGGSVSDRQRQSMLFIKGEPYPTVQRAIAGHRRGQAAPPVQTQWGILAVAEESLHALLYVVFPTITDARFFLSFDLQRAEHRRLVATMEHTHLVSISTMPTRTTPTSVGMCLDVTASIRAALEDAGTLASVPEVLYLSPTPITNAEWDAWSAFGCIPHHQMPRLPLTGRDRLEPLSLGPYLGSATHPTVQYHELCPHEYTATILDGDSSALSLITYRCFADVPPYVSWMTRMDRSLRPHPDSARRALRAAPDQIPSAVALQTWFLSIVAERQAEERDAWLSSFVIIESSLEVLYQALTGKAIAEGIRGAFLGALDVLEPVLGTIPRRLSPLAALEQLSSWGQALWTDRAGWAAVWMRDHPPQDDERDVIYYGRSLLQSLAVLACWGQQPPVAHPQTTHAARNALALTLTRWRRCLLRNDPLTPPLSGRARWLLRSDMAPIWEPWRWMHDGTIGKADDELVLDSLASATLQAAASELCRELEHAIRTRGDAVLGRYMLRLPDGFAPLTERGVTQVIVDAGDQGWRWIRIACTDDADGLVLPWRRGEAPPPIWQHTLPETARWSLHLVLTAWERDMAVTGAERVLFVAAGSRSAMVPPTAAPPPRPKGRAPSPLMVPRTPTSRIRLVPEPPDVQQAEYGQPEDRAAVDRRAAMQHLVRAHSIQYRSPVRRKASDRIRAMIARLPLEDRLALIDGPELPPSGMTVRGLVEGPDGTITRAYVRGSIEPEPRETVALRGLVVARLALSAALASLKDAS